MKHLTGILIVVLVIAMAAGTAFDAGAQKRSTTTKRKTTPVTNTVTKLDCPAYDAANPANSGGEALSEFLDKWSTDKAFRAERSANVSFGNYYDGELFVGDEPNEFMLQIVMSPEDYLADPVCYDFPKNFKEPYKKVKKRGTKELSGVRAEWAVVNADLAVFVIEDWDNVGEAGGSSLQYIFQRIDGKWYLTAIAMAG